MAAPLPFAWFDGQDGAPGDGRQGAKRSRFGSLSAGSADATCRAKSKSSCEQNTRWYDKSTCAVLYALTPSSLMRKMPRSRLAWTAKYVLSRRTRAYRGEILEKPLGDGDVKLYLATDHRKNWLECIAAKKATICPAEVGHRSASICHLGNIGYQLRRPLKWDPEKEQFIGDDEANKHVARPMREPWTL